jgi:hypothetical protein
MMVPMPSYLCKKIFDKYPTFSAIWYNPLLAMHLLDKYKLPNSSESVVEQFFNQLFSDAEVFIGIHDKKVRSAVNRQVTWCSF